MTLSNEIWFDNNKLRNAFSWLTRIGAAPKFGSLPIGYYQRDQCAAIDALKTAAEKHNVSLSRVRFSQGRFYAYSLEPFLVVRSRRRWFLFARLTGGKIVTA